MSKKEAGLLKKSSRFPEKSFTNTSVILGRFVCFFFFYKIIQCTYHRIMEYAGLEGTNIKWQFQL